MNIYNTQCCGVREIAGISDQPPEDVVRMVIDRYLENTPRQLRGAYYTFTCNSDNDGNYGDTLAGYIVENNLGEVISSRFIQNPNSGNRLCIYVWNVNPDSFAGWLEQNPQKSRVPEHVRQAGQVIAEVINRNVGDFVRLTPRGIISAGEHGFNGTARLLGRQRIGGIQNVLLEREDGVVNATVGNLSFWAMPVKYMKHLRDGAEFDSRFIIQD